MQVAEGPLEMLGNSTSNPKIVTYTAIEIGSTILQNKRVPRSLDSFMQKSLGQPGDSKIFYRGKMILGFQAPGGKLYCYDANLIGAGILIICGVPLILFFGIGLFFIWQGIAELLNASAASELRGRGAIAVKL